MAVRIGLWKNTTKDGKTFISGNNDFILIPPGAYFSIWPNAEKKDPKQPDYYLNVSEPKPREVKDGSAGSNSLDHIPF